MTYEKYPRRTVGTFRPQENEFLFYSFAPESLPFPVRVRPKLGSTDRESREGETTTRPSAPGLDWCGPGVRNKGS